MQLAQHFEGLNGSLIEGNVSRRTVLAPNDSQNGQWDGDAFPEQVVLLTQAQTRIERQIELWQMFRAVCLDGFPLCGLFIGRKKSNSGIVLGTVLHQAGGVVFGLTIANGESIAVSRLHGS